MVDLKKVQSVVPGTQQVQITPLVTMVMTIVTWSVTEFVYGDIPELVWTAVTGLLIYGLQYWHGPR